MVNLKDLNKPSPNIEKPDLIMIKAVDILHVLFGFSSYFVVFFIM